MFPPLSRIQHPQNTPCHQMAWLLYPTSPGEKNDRISIPLARMDLCNATVLRV